MTITNDNRKKATRLAWRLEEVAKETGLSVQFLRKEIRNKNLTAIKKGRCILVLDEEIRNYLIR